MANILASLPASEENWISLQPPDTGLAQAWQLQSLTEGRFLCVPKISKGEKQSFFFFFLLEKREMADTQ